MVEERKEETMWALLVYLLSIVGVIIVYFTDKKKNDFVMYHTKQSIALFIISVLISLVGGVIPVLGWFLIMPLGYLFVVILWVLGILNALKGERKPLPLIGEYADKLEL